VYFTIALINGADPSDTAQLLIFIPGTNNQFDTVTELLDMQAVKGTITDVDLHERLSTTLNDISYSATS
jgi:hypothetical protein